MGRRKEATTEKQQREHAACVPAREQSRVLLTTVEAGAYVRHSHRTLERYRVTGQGPAYVQPGRRVFYERQALDDWLERGRRRSTSDSGPRPPRS